MPEEEQLTMFGDDTPPNSPFPAVSQALVLELDKLFPDRCPTLSEPDRLIWVKAGQRAVVRFLQEKLKEQEETHYVL